MEEYIVSARKYRPMTFDSVVGQEALTTTLKNAVKTKKLAHAYLFCGPRGVGKTTCARIFAKAINCEHPGENGEACNECESCKAFNEGRSYNIFELDAASNNSVENIKSLMEQTRIPPQIGRYKVFIIDEVHMLSTAAFNAFLKTLEEPPAHVIFILATTEKHKILPTILSRCQIYDFERMTVPDTISHLKKIAEREGITYEDQALDIIAEKADGGMRDALSIFDQVASYSQGHITYQNTIEDLNVLDSDNYFNIIDLALENKISDMMLLLNSILEKGFNGSNLISGLAEHVRNVMMAKDESTISLLETSKQQKEKFKNQAKNCPQTFLYKALEIMNQCDIHYRESSNKRLLVELTLIEVGQITQTEDKDIPVAGRTPHRLKTLFKKLIHVQPKPAQQVAGAGQRLIVASRQQTPKAEPVTINETSSIETADSTDTVHKIDPSIAAHFFNSWSNLSQQPVKKSHAAMKEIEAEKELKKEQSKGEQTEFTQEELELQWMIMCNRMASHKEFVGIAARMKNMVPKITVYPNIELVMENEFLLKQITEVRNRIKATMVALLHNADINFSLRLAKAEEAGKILTKREIFEQLCEDHPAIERLRKDFHLDLA
ncbi:MAG TPA: DNA polymerase III subunit gamma/tau [Prevotella sp.]|nr:DNA polymerase III subunit gamma/tau [Prevotella sp.]